MSALTCDNLIEGVKCEKPATHIVYTPWSKRLACDTCKYIFEGQGREVRTLEFTCDWPMGAHVVCGEKATHYVEFNNYPSAYHRPICKEHADRCLIAHPIDDGVFDPRLVTYKPKMETAPRIHHKADGTVVLTCHCGAPGRIRASTDGYPLCDEHAPRIEAKPREGVFGESSDFKLPERPSRPPLRDAFIDVAQAILEHAKQKLENLRKEKAGG